MTKTVRVHLAGSLMHENIVLGEYLNGCKATFCNALLGASGMKEACGPTPKAAMHRLADVLLDDTAPNATKWAVAVRDAAYEMAPRTGNDVVQLHRMTAGLNPALRPLRALVRKICDMLPKAA